MTPKAIDDLFRDGGRSRKGEFAFALAGRLRDALAEDESVTIPEQIAAVFAFLHPDDTDDEAPLDDTPGPD